MAVWTPHPNSIVKVRATGTGDMGSVTGDSPNVSAGMDERFVLVAFLAWASGGSGDAEVILYQKIFDQPTGLFDEKRRSFKSFGTDATSDTFIDSRIEADQFPHWVLDANDLWVPNWTNPGGITWKVEFQLAPADQ